MSGEVSADWVVAESIDSDVEMAVVGAGISHAASGTLPLLPREWRRSQPLINKQRSYQRLQQLVSLSLLLKISSRAC